MPELPEVETVARTLAPQIMGKVITGVDVLLPKTLEAGKALLPALKNGEVKRVWRRGKVLLVDVAGEKPLTLAFHLKMTGQLFVYGADAEPGKHTRLVFGLADKAGGTTNARLFFNDSRTFGYCRVMLAEDFAAWPFWQKLGPEPLDLAAEDFVERFRAKRGAIKAALLDQGIIAGIGNIYADESLFLAKIRPDAACRDIAPKRLRDLSLRVKEVLEESIRQCGSSIRDYRDAEGNAGAFQNTFNVYGRHGERCRVCGEALEKTVVAGRTTVYCPRCQRR